LNGLNRSYAREVQHRPFWWGRDVPREEVRACRGQDIDVGEAEAVKALTGQHVKRLRTHTHTHVPIVLLLCTRNALEHTYLAQKQT